MVAALEAAIVLKLDAQITCPTVGLTTTTRDPAFTFEQLRKAERFLWRALRREYDPLEYVAFLEWTTGTGTHSGGHRRPHLHHLVKGIPVDDPSLGLKVLDDGSTTTDLEQRVSELWRRYTQDAWVVDCRPLRTPAGAIAYLALHHHKREQAPPPGFTGRRLRPSKGYYEQPIADLRRLAQTLLRDGHVERAVRRVIAVEAMGEEPLGEYEADERLTTALVHALRDLAAHPLELQFDFDHNLDWEREEEELVARTITELERLCAERPPELVRVHEEEVVDRATGTTHGEAIAVLGPLSPRRRRAA